MFEDNYVIPYYRNIHPEMEKRFRDFEEKYGVMSDKTRRTVYATLCYYCQVIDDNIYRGDLKGQRYDNRFTIRANYNITQFENIAEKDITDDAIETISDYFKIFGVIVDVHKMNNPMKLENSGTFIVVMSVGDVYKISNDLYTVRTTNLYENLKRQMSNEQYYAPREGIISQSPSIYTTGVSLKRVTDEFMTFGF